MTKQKINVMLLISSISGAGAELVVANLCKYLEKDKFNVFCCHLKERGERGDDLYRAGYNIIPLRNNSSRTNRYFAFTRLRTLVKKYNIDIINSHNSEPFIEASLCKLITPKVKVIHTFHYGNYPNLDKKLYYSELLLSRIPDLLVAVGHEQRKKIIKHFPINPKNIVTIYNGVDKIKANILDISKYKPNKNAITISAISTLTKQKGLEQVLHLAKMAKDRNLNCHFVIVGDGPKYQDLVNLCNNLKLNDIVTFLGWIKNAANKILPVSDIFIQTSYWEAMSTAILEAMSYGIPLLATDVGENKNIIENANAGYVTHTDDLCEMINNIEHLVSKDDLRRKLGTNAKTAYEKNYNVHHMVQNYQSLFKTIQHK